MNCNLCQKKINLKQGLVGIASLVICRACFKKLIIDFEKTEPIQKKKKVQLKKVSILRNIFDLLGGKE